MSPSSQLVAPTSGIGRGLAKTLVLFHDSILAIPHPPLPEL